MPVRFGIEAYLKLSWFNNVLDRLRNDNVEVVVSSLLQHRNYDCVALNAPLTTEREMSAFRVLVASPTMRSILVLQKIEATVVEELLDIAIESMSNISGIFFATDARIQSEETFSGSDVEVAQVVAKYLRELPLTVFGLDWSVSKAAFGLLCNAMGESPAVREIFLNGEATFERDTIETAARALVTSTSITNVTLCSSPAFTDGIRKILMGSQAARNLELCYQEEGEADTDRVKLTLCRGSQWRRVLSQTIPLSLWPHILAKANTWEQQTSHNSLDALFFLVREKSDVLLQNVHRRRIRKRKRFQFS